MAPGSEPILLDLEKLFLLSDSMENLNLYQIFEKSTFFMKTKGNWLNPGHEPILLDLEKLFLLSVSLENERK